jgi:general secretion pathway protein G
MKRVRGFSLVELIVTLAILGVLAGLAVPTVELFSRRQREAELRRALREIRSAIDSYKKAVDEGKIMVKADQSGYPPNLEVLYRGVLVETDLSERANIYFLRRLPRDPFFPDSSVPANETWGLRSYQSEYNRPARGADVYDVYSLSPDSGLNGVHYKDW